MTTQKEKYIPLSVPNITDLEIEYVVETLDQGWISSVGPIVNKFEEAISSYVGSKYACACSSGTTGLHLALLSVGVDSRDIVLVPTLTFIAAVNPVKYIGAEPIFFDCDESLCLDPNSIKSFLNEECVIQDGNTIHKESQKIVKAMIVVHVFGNIANMSELMGISKKYNIKLIEDATEALGSKFVDGQFSNGYAGTFGDIGVYSFNGNKIISTGSGGMLVSNNKVFIDKAKHLSTQAKSDSVYYFHDEIGYNYRLSSIQAALGLAQLARIEGFIKTKESSNKFYSNKLNQYSNLSIVGFTPGTRPNYWLSSIRVSSNVVRDELMIYMGKNKIEARPIWDLIHKQNPYKSARIYGSQNADKFLDTILNIPSSTNITFEELERVVEVISEYFNEL